MIPLLLATALAGSSSIEVASFEGAHAQRPSWSADGFRLAVEANDHEARRIALHVGPPEGPLSVVKPASRASSDITAGFATGGSKASVVHEIAWPPKGFGDTFVYVASDDRQDFDLYLEGAGRICEGPGADGGPAWSPDGTWIAFTSARTGEGDLYLAKASALEEPPRQITALRTGSELYPAWSRDGSMLAWVAHSRTGDNLFLLTDLDGSPQKLTDWSGNQIRPSFSPTQDKLAFYANKEDSQRFDLYVMDAKPGAEARIVLRNVLPDSAGPSWTPDGGSLIAVLDDDNALDPVVRVPERGGAHQVLDLGTVGNGDLAVTQREGKVWLAWVAQGRKGDPVRDFKRLFVAPLSP